MRILRIVLAALAVCCLAAAQSASLMPMPKIQFLDANGVPVAGGFVYTYSAGTTTPLVTYTDASGSTPNADPVVLDSGGFANIWLGANTYKIVLQDKHGVQIWSVDNVSNPSQIQSACANTPNCFVKLDGNGFVPQANLNYIQGATNSVNRTVQNRLQDYVSVKDFGAVGNGTADDTTALQASLNWACPIGAKVFLPQGRYEVTSTITTPGACEGIDFGGPSDSEITGHGAQIVWGGAANGTVFNVYSTGWSKFHDFQIDGSSTAGIGLLFDADTTSPVVRSSQKDIFSHIYVTNVTGSPGNCLQVGRLGHADDVSQSNFDDLSINHCVVGLYQAGGQTVENLYRKITFGTSISKYSAEFDEGDIHLSDSLFIGGGPSSKIANVYVKSTALRADFERNYYEDTTGLDPTVFSNYLFPAGANPNRSFSTKIDSDRVEWVLLGGKVLNYQQAGPLLVINPTGDDIFGANDPGMYYVTSGNHIQTVQARFSGGFLSNPSQAIAIDDNVILNVDNTNNQVMGNVFEGRDASVTNGSTTLTVGTGAFTSSMVNFVCLVQGYLSGGAAQETTVTAFISSTQVTLSSAATASGSGLYYRCGRLVNAGQANAAMGDTGKNASNVAEGQLPQYQLRRFLLGTAWQNWAWRVDSGGSHMSLMSGDNPSTASYSDFFDLLPTVAGGTTAGSVRFQVPISSGTVDATSSFQANGVPGFSGTKTAGACVFTISEGIITAVSGC